LPVKVALPRASSGRRSWQTKKGIADGTSTSSSAPTRCSAKGIKFKDLGLLIIDEEQHFGVAHKERLKELKSDVHVLTLTRDADPAHLQLAMTGVRELSLIATPPVDRLACAPSSRPSIR
jgi:transcription-repair coupling factor (superfamily II helicase)